MKIVALAPLAVLVGLVCGDARGQTQAAGTPPLRAQLVCERLGVPGRVKCDVEAQIDDGRITWADAEIIEMPAFAIALKGRIGPDDATVKTPLRWRFAFGVVTKENGSGSISVRVRAVRCRERTCEALSTTVVGALVVGS